MTRQALQAKESAPAKKSSFSWLRPAAAHPAAEAEHEAPSASSPAFAHDFTRVPVRPMQLPGVPGFSCPFAPQRCPSGGACHTCPPKLQAKLKIGQPGDQCEQEADRVAETVMRMPEPQVQRKCSAPGCKEEDEDKKLLQTKPAGGGESRAYVDHPLIQSVLSSPGQPLDAGTRSFMEPRFGQDFSGVRVHTDGQAAESARAVNARAYTVGRDVVFGEGQYAPGSDEGKRLMAHELVHVGQQSSVGGSILWRVPDRDEIPNRYSFSSNCGWIDWGHADPGLVNTLITRVRNASDALQRANPTGLGDMNTPTMTSAVPRLGMVLSSASLSVRLLRPLSAGEVFEVALSLFKKLSIVFETQQEWTDLVGSSSFAQEDLPSNLISFYRAARGFSRSDISRFCGELSANDSKAEYDRDHDFEKNRSFTPVGISGAWPPELSTIDDRQAASLYDIRSISAVQGTTGFRFCPIYRIEGTIGETDLFIFSVGGVRFTTADNVRVVPTYRFRPGTHGAYGHTTFVEIMPYGQADSAAFAQHGISSPIYVAQNILVCLSSQAP